jgi:hypothetical protein
VSYSIDALVNDMRVSFGPTASARAIGLMLEARRRGMMHERDVFTSAAILLCTRRSTDN